MRVISFTGKGNSILAYQSLRDGCLVNITITQNTATKMFNNTPDIVKIGLWRCKKNK